jgi:TRAP-type C4-dicarboxylate transport system substrate-binding protein
MRRTATIMSACALVLLAGCTGTPTPSETAADEPATLTFAYTGSFADPQIAAFQQTLAASGDAVRLEVSTGFDTDVLGVEQSILKAVRAGDLDLGWVGVRALAELGVHDFDALIAPLLIDSLATQRAVLDSGVPSRMIPGLEAIGVTGLAVMGGPMRRPIAAERPLLTQADFVGIPFYAWHGEVNAASLVALGAQAVDAAPPDRNAGIEDGSIRAYENTAAYLADAPERRANIMTANINLWPSIGILVANPDTLAALTEDARAALEDAAFATSVRAIDVLDAEADRVQIACEAGARFAHAPADALAELRVAVEPVYAVLRADAATSEFVDEILELKGSMPPDSLDIPAGCAAE